MDPYVYKVDLVRIIDGDTVVVDVDLGLGTWVKNQYLRLWGINTPELRGRGRSAGLRAKARLADMLEGRELRVRTLKDKTGKYGRWLAELYIFGEAVGWINLNKELLREGLAAPADY